tara:strand:- start:1397 stop:2860 length:1464 start_codon:yes stop_codon:yes gene_type:complete
MPYYKFRKEDIFHNVIKAHPKARFDIHGGNIYYNLAYRESGSFTGSVPNVPPGHINLYEMNIDRSGEDVSDDSPELIYSFLSKESSSGFVFKTITTASFNIAMPGDQFTYSYPLSASLSREYYELGTDQLGTVAENRYARRKVLKDSDHFEDIPKFVEPAGVYVSSSFVDSLRNTLDHYVNLSAHYAFSASNKSWTFGQYDKGHQELNMIYIPSIFYGSSIKKGSVSLKWYVSGTLMAECTDRERNGELIQVSGSGRPTRLGDSSTDRSNGYIFDSNTGSYNNVAGVVLYKEGFLVLTGSWPLHDSYTDQFRYDTVDDALESAESPKWTYFGVGMNDGSGSVVSAPYSLSDDSYNVSSSFVIEFQGTNHIPVMTAFAHAPKGYLNFSNNPTYVSGTLKANSAGQKILTGAMTAFTNSYHYKEHDEDKITNIVSSSYTNYTASFKKQTYISKIGIYDKNRYLIAVAKLSTPVKKTEDRDLTFKLKLDF